MAKKFYAVQKGTIPGIYTTWAECQQNINGFPGAIFKSFPTKNEAEEFLTSGKQTSRSEEPISRVYSESEAIAYVDGSYSQVKNEYSYGVVMFYDSGEEHFAEKFSDKEMALMRNVAGEIEGSKRAMKFCIEKGIKSIDIVYDYEGIEKWCTGAWKANKEGTKEYKKFYNEVKKSIYVNFVKVKGHSGNKYNDLADFLAKSALGIGEGVKPISEHSNGIVANNIRYDDLIQIIELLKEDFQDLNCSPPEEIPYGEMFTLNINNPTKQRLVIKYFKLKNKLLIQGKKEDLFNRLSLYIIELLEIDEIPTFLNTVHDLNVDSDVVQSEFNSYFPNSYKLIPSEMNKYLHQSVYNLHIMGNMYVTNFLVEPAIRPLEAILKIALQDNEIPIRKEGMEYDSFFVFKNDNGKYRLKDDYIKESHSAVFLEYLSECYSYLHNNRHTLFHWDNPNEIVDTTRILNTVEEAHTIIKDSIRLIDKYYTIV